MKRRLSVLAAVVTAVVATGTAWAGFPNILGFDDPQLVYAGGTGAATLALSTESGSSGFADPRVLVEEVVVVAKEGVLTTLTARFEAVYVCVNGGGNVPSAANKTTLVGNLEASAVFPPAKNGRATGSLLTESLPSAEEATAATGFACPAGQRLEFDRAVFFGLVLAVEGGEEIGLDSTFASQSVHGLS